MVSLTREHTQAFSRCTENLFFFFLSPYRVTHSIPTERNHQTPIKPCMAQTEVSCHCRATTTTTTPPTTTTSKQNVKLTHFVVNSRCRCDSRKPAGPCADVSCTIMHRWTHVVLGSTGGSWRVEPFGRSLVGCSGIQRQIQKGRSQSEAHELLQASQASRYSEEVKVFKAFCGFEYSCIIFFFLRFSILVIR